MKQTTTQRRAGRVTPSAPGSVDAWLDMLVSMLALPKHERQRIRDELEDHLRSRIDDLLIIGLSEPDALKQAASELGETADLARQLTHAHATPRKRTYAMHAALIALAGSIVAVGVTNLGPNTLAPQSSPAAAAGHAEHGSHPHAYADTHTASASDPNTVSIVIGDLPFPEAFRVVAESFGLGPGLSQTLLNRYEKHQSRVSMSGSFTLEEAIGRLLTFDPYGSESNAYYIENGRIIIADPMVVIRRSVVTKTYPLDWADINEHHDLALAVMDALVNGPYPQFVTVNDSVGSLVVTARADAQAEVERILDELRTNLQRRADGRASAAEARRAMIRAEHEKLVEQRFAARERLALIQDRISLLSTKLVFADTPKDEREVAEAELAVLKRELEREQFNFSVLDESMEYLRARMIEVEYGDLFDGLSMGDHALPGMSSGPIRVEGDVQRPGLYTAPVGGSISLRRMVDAAGGFSGQPGRVHLIRDGQHLATVDAAGLVGESGGIELQSGDRIRVAGAIGG